MSHTPGPWEIKRDIGHFDSATSIRAHQLVGVNPSKYELSLEIGGWASVEKLEANARLIAAAPELLEALEAFDKAAKESTTIIGFAAKAFKLLTKTRAAIAKARGQG
jgi:hypothetical protein